MRLVALLLLGLLPGLLQAATLDGAWRQTQPGDTPAQVLAEARNGRLTPFDPARATAFPRHSVWIVLWPAPPWIPQVRMLSLRAPLFGDVTLFGQHGATWSNAIDDFGDAVHGHGRVAFRLPATWPASKPILLKFDPGAIASAPLSFRLQSIAEYQRDDAAWLTMASACLGVMLAMAAMAVCFALMLRDIVFVWYACFIASYLLMQSLQTGFAFHPLGLRLLAGSNYSFGLVVVAMALAFAMMFMRSFCNLARFTPVLHQVLLWLTFAVVLQMLFISIDVPMIRQLGQLLLNPLLAICLLTMLAAAALSTQRGSRTAGYFLACWTPLLVLTALATAQSAGLLDGPVWLHDACLVAAALASVVLSMGLADRALAVRRDRDQARMLANSDALTGLLNRRAWTEAATARLAEVEAAPQVLFFLDLDHFKRLNDRYGHAAGDRALVELAQTLRDYLHPDDLLGRYGGEEFVALFNSATHTDAMHIAISLCRRVGVLDIPVDSSGGVLTVSIGVAMQRPDDTVASLLRRADMAMYAAKAKGRNCAVWEGEDRRSADSPMRVVPLPVRGNRTR